MELWKLIALVAGGLIVAYLFLSCLGRPTRYRKQRFADFPKLFGYWAESIDRGGRIFIEPEHPGVPRLGFRLVGRGSRKSLRVTVPRRRSSEAELRSQLDSLASHFDQVEVVAKPRSLELRLPAAATYTASIASRAAEAAFLSLGCTAESTFTIYGSSVAFDPYYELRVTEQAAESATGVLKRWFEKRAARIRSHLRQRRRPGGPAA